MLNYIWFGMMAIAVIVGVFTGRIDAVTEAAIDMAKVSVEIAIGLIGIMALWLGVMKIAEESGLISLIARAVKPVMIRLFPDRDDYWRQLSGIRMTLNQPAQALAVMELMMRSGRLTREPELIQLARLYLYQEIPYKAARLLEDAMKAGQIRKSADNRTLLATAWALARERDQAIRSYHLAAQASNRADVDFTLAQLYLEDERWTEATRALETALAKPGWTPATCRKSWTTWA